MSPRRKKTEVPLQRTESPRERNGGEAPPISDVNEEEIDEIKQEENEAGLRIPAIPSKEGNDGPRNVNSAQKVVEEQAEATEDVKIKEEIEEEPPSLPKTDKKVAPTCPDVDHDTHDDNEVGSSANAVLPISTDESVAVSGNNCLPNLAVHSKNNVDSNRNGVVGTTSLKQQAVPSVNEYSRKLRNRSSLIGKEGNATSYMEPDSDSENSDDDQRSDEERNDSEYEHSRHNPIGLESKDNNTQDRISPSPEETSGNETVPSTGSRRFKCDVCDKIFIRSGHLEEHKRIHTGEKLFKCDVCDKRFPSCRYLEEHKRIHTGEKPFACSVCDQRFSFRSGRLKHEQNHTGEKPHACTICNKRFSQRYYLLNHIPTHTDEEPYQCSICEKRMKRNNALQRLMLLFHKGPRKKTVPPTGPRKFKCDVCDKLFITSSNLRDHERIHTGERPFACSFCDKRFTQKGLLKMHQRIHTGEKPYKCDVCEKSFVQLGSLQSHKASHSEEKPFACSICDMRFNQSSNLRTHERRHTGTELFSCMFCRLPFDTRVDMVNHREKEHPSSSQVPNTDKSPANVSTSNVEILNEKKSGETNVRSKMKDQTAPRVNEYSRKLRDRKSLIGNKADAQSYLEPDSGPDEIADDGTSSDSEYEHSLSDSIPRDNDDNDPSHSGNAFDTMSVMVDHREKEHLEQFQNMNNSLADGSVDSNSRVDSVKKKSKASNAIDANTTSPDDLALRLRSASVFPFSATNKDMAKKSVKRRGNFTVSSETVGPEPEKKKPRKQDSHPEPTLTELMDNGANIYVTHDAFEYLENSLSCKSDQNPETPLEHPVILSPLFCISCKIGFSEKDDLNQHNMNTHMVLDGVMQSTKFDAAIIGDFEEPCPAEVFMENVSEEIEETSAEVNTVTTMDMDCSNITKDACTDIAGVTQVNPDLSLPANISNSKQEPGCSQKIRYKRASIEEEVDRIAFAHPNNLYLVWSEKFSLDLALAVARNSSNCVLVVRNFSLTSLVEVGNMVETHHTSVVKIGPNPDSWRFFSFGRMILPDKILDNGRFKSIAKLESTMRKFMNVQGKKLVNVIKFTQGEDGWIETLQRDLKEDLIITNAL